MIHHKHWYLPNFVLCFLFFIFRKDFGLIRALSLLAGKEEEDDKVEGTTSNTDFFCTPLECFYVVNRFTGQQDCTSSGGAGSESLVPLLELTFPLSQMTSDEVLTYTTLPKQLHVKLIALCLHNMGYMLCIVWLSIEVTLFSKGHFITSEGVCSSQYAERWVGKQYILLLWHCLVLYRTMLSMIPWILWGNVFVIIVLS